MFVLGNSLIIISLFQFSCLKVVLSKNKHFTYQQSVQHLKTEFSRFY